VHAVLLGSGSALASCLSALYSSVCDRLCVCSSMLRASDRAGCSILCTVSMTVGFCVTIGM